MRDAESELRSNAKISQTWSDINLVTAGPRSSSLSALSRVMAALFTASLQISSAGSFSHLSNSQTLEDGRRIFWQPVSCRNFSELMIHEKPPLWAVFGLNLYFFGAFSPILYLRWGTFPVKHNFDQTWHKCFKFKQDRAQDKNLLLILHGYYQNTSGVLGLQPCDNLSGISSLNTFHTWTFYSFSIIILVSLILSPGGRVPTLSSWIRILICISALSSWSRNKMQMIMLSESCF